MDHVLDRIAIPSDPAVSPDGERVAFSVSAIDVEGDRYVKQIWLAEGGTVRRFTAGIGDTAPRFSPDGRHLAFLRIEDERPQVAVMPVGGGEPRLVTDFGVGALSEPAWSPEGATIAVVGGAWQEGWGDLDDEERSRRPRRITERDYRTDELGWVHDRRRHVYLVDITAPGQARRLTDRPEEEAAPAWSPDGATVAFLSETARPRGYRYGAEVYAADVVSGQVTRVGPMGHWVKLSYRPDGVLHSLGSEGDSFPEPAMLWRFGADAVLVNAGYDRSVFSFAAGPPRLVWDEEDALVTLVDSGEIGLARVRPDGTTDEVYLERAVVTGFDLSGGTRAMTVSTIASPGRLVVERGDEMFEHDDFDGTAPPVIQPEHFVAEGQGADLDVWVYLPEGDGPVPLLLNIHGGPASQYGWGFFDEFQVYAAAGYGVVATNPRGSAGRDREFLRAVAGEGWGRVDVEDVDTVVADALRRFPRLDPQRLGVMGGSYGGFLTAWLVAHQPRWRSAIVERALLSFPSFAGTSDIGGWFADRYLGDPELAWDRSPMRVAHQIRTPILILHSENDFRCPIEEAEQLFDTLLRNGVDTELVRFPGEGHELTRSGQPRHRVERFEVILEWLERTLR